MQRGIFKDNFCFCKQKEFYRTVHLQHDSTLESSSELQSDELDEEELEEEEEELDEEESSYLSIPSIKSTGPWLKGQLSNKRGFHLINHLSNSFRIESRFVIVSWII